jgi:hypothetical protein
VLTFEGGLSPGGRGEMGIGRRPWGVTSSVAVIRAPSIRASSLLSGTGSRDRRMEMYPLDLGGHQRRAAGSTYWVRARPLWARHDAYSMPTLWGNPVPALPLGGRQERTGYPPEGCDRVSVLPYAMVDPLPPALDFQFQDSA